MLNCGVLSSNAILAVTKTKVNQIKGTQLISNNLLSKMVLDFN
jgi:hypothetical protein